jgi:predicted O-methyltransferase YrrM
LDQGTTNFSKHPARQGLRQLLTVAALRTLIHDPAVFLANLRQGPEFFLDRRRKQDLAEIEEYIEGEAKAVSSVLGIDESRYQAASCETWLPPADPNDPLSAWNAREELLRMVGTIVKLMRPAVVVETGVALGFTTATVLHVMAEAGEGHLYSVDLPALQYDPGDPVGRAVPSSLRERWTLELGDSRKKLKPLCARVAPVDIFLHDALHTYSSQLREYRTAWPFIRPRGLLISDDVNNPAFTEFASEVEVRPHLVAGPSRSDAVGLLRKP